MTLGDCINTEFQPIVTSASSCYEKHAKNRGPELYNGVLRGEKESKIGKVKDGNKNFKIKKIFR